MSIAKERLDQLAELCWHLRGIDPTMNMNELVVVMIVAQKPGITIDGICDVLERDIAKSTVSRLVDRNGDPPSGKGLLTKERGVDGNNRNVMVYLTPKGEQFLKDLWKIIG